MQRASKTRDQRAVQVKPFEGGNIRHCHSIEIYSFASISQTQRHPASEDLARDEIISPQRAELISQAT
jgi:hypothetical protein